jgi:hypothetical protein
MDKAAIIDALSVTDANAKEMLKIFSEQYTDAESVSALLVKCFETIKEAESLPVLDKVILTAQFAMCAGYMQALKDVQTVQRSELADI